MVKTMSRGLLILPLSFALLAGCSDDDPAGPQDVSTDFSTYLDDFVAQVVVPTYADLRDGAADLATASAELLATPDQPNVNAAAAAWANTRAPWESSEAFLYGPAAYLSLDPALDSWPVDQQQLEDVLDSGLDLTPDFVANGLGPAVRGFHTIEYLIFRNGQPRDVGDFTPRELQYLAAAATVLADEANTLWAAWAEGLDGGTPYGDMFARAGQSGSSYPSQGAAIQELIEGMIGICDEVANGKIADPYDENDTALVESQFSFNSLTDFGNNLRSVQNAYLGEYHGGSFDGVGIDEFVASQNADLGTMLQAQIAAAIAAIADIPAPFRNNLGASTQIEAAQAAITAVQTTLQASVLPLVVQ